MKSFVKGMLGAFLVLIAAFIVIPLYSDYRARSETSDWLTHIQATKVSVADNAVKFNSLSGSGAGVTPPSGLRSDPEFTITNDGIIFVHGKKYGQLLVIIPELSGGKVSWTCMGGSAKDVPPFCRAH